MDVEMSDESAEVPSLERSTSWLGRLAPQSRRERIFGALAILFLAGAIGYFVGGRTLEDGRPDSGSADVGFLYDMSAHHQQAVQLSMLELTNGTDPTIQTFAREILRSQSYEIGLMEMRLGIWGFDPGAGPDTAMAWMGMSMPASAMPGMADAAELEAMRSATGSDADALFLALMSDHHVGGVRMAEEAAESAGDSWVIDTARRMAAIQASEIAEMEAARVRAGLEPDPFGFSPDFADGEPAAMHSTDDE